MSKYSEREKRGHFNKLRGHASHIDADLKLLEQLSPKHELLSTATRKDRIGDQILLALLDLTTSCDIVAFRREFSKHKGLSVDELMLAKYIDNYNKNIIVLMGKYGVDNELDTTKKIADVFDSLGFTPFIRDVLKKSPKTIFDMVGCTLRDCTLINTIIGLVIDEDTPVVDQIRSGILERITDSIKQRDARRDKEFVDAYNAKVNAFISKYGEDFVFGTVEDVAIMFQMLGHSMPDPQNETHIKLSDLIGVPVSELPFLKQITDLSSSDAINFEVLKPIIDKFKVEDKTLSADNSTEDLSEKEIIFAQKEEELGEKESELAEKESELEDKESELEDKEQKLSEKEEELSKESEEGKKKAEQKKKNTPK